MQLHNLQRNKALKTKKRVGRGSARGKTSGRGHKGQKARAGHRIKPQSREEVKRIPKLRGHKSSFIAKKPEIINLSVISSFFENGESVTPETLISKGVILKTKDKKLNIKILGNGEIDKKINVRGCLISGTAKSKIEKAGGSVV